MQKARRILLVEDETRLRRTLARCLHRQGLEVHQAGCLADAERRLDRERFDAVVFDVGLPDGDGLALLQRTSPQRSLVISATPSPERFARSGVLHHLTKPFDLSEFARRVLGLSEA